MNAMNRAKIVAMAVHNYQLALNVFPPAIIPDSHNVPLHSWRVALTPYLMADPFYNLYDRSQPWNSPANDKLPRVQLCQV